jgi:hypothetical protein
MKPIERDRPRGGRSLYRTASTDRASRPIDLPQQMVGWIWSFQPEVLGQSLRPRLSPFSGSRSCLQLGTKRTCPNATAMSHVALATETQKGRLV